MLQPHHLDSKIQVAQVRRCQNMAAESEVRVFRRLPAVALILATVNRETHYRYGIVYHANYITYALRAMERTFGAGAPTPNVHALHHMKYRAAATLGETAVVSGTLVSCDLTSRRSRWRFQITAADPSRVFVHAEATMSWPGVGALPPGIRPPPADQGASVQLTDTRLLQPLPAAFQDSPKVLCLVVRPLLVLCTGQIHHRPNKITPLSYTKRAAKQTQTPPVR